MVKSSRNQTESDGGCQEQREGERGSYCVMGAEVQVLEEGVTKMGSGDDGAAL